MTRVGMHVGRYELLRLLSAGGMGEVYLARQTSSVEGFATLAAIKVLLENLSTNPSFVSMFLDEARIVGRLHHKNIVQIRDIAEHDGHYYMVMEYIAGQTLRDLLGDASIRDRPLFDPRLGCQVFAELASALGTAHAAHLVHRDVSPNNIMISDEGVPKLIDFGVARALGSASLTTPGTLKGKIGYMAPEYIRGDTYDARSDVFSLGVVMWETFARKRLFRGDSAVEHLRLVLEREIPRLDVVDPSIPADLATLVQGALERDPQRRIPSANMLSDALAALADALPAGADPTLRQWLERRIPGRIADRAASDRSLVSLPLGAPIPDFEPPARVQSTGSYASNQSVISSGHADSFAGADRSSSVSGVPARASIQLATATITPPSSAPSRPPARSRAVVFASVGAALALALGLVVTRGIGDTRSTTAPPTAVTTAAPAPAGAGGDAALAAAHRQVGLTAMADGDYAGARAAFANALRAGGGGDLAELMRLATQLETEAHAQRAAAATVPAPTAAPAPTAPDPSSPSTEETTARPTATRPPVAKTPARRRGDARPSKPEIAASAQVHTAAVTEPEVAAPVAPTPPPPTTGDLVVTSVTPSAAVLVDGALVGQTPLRLPILPGEHRLVVRTGDQQLEARTLTIVAGETARVNVETQPAPQPTPAPVPRIEPTPPRPARPTPTPRVTASGDASAGARVVAACNSCHARSGATVMSGRHYTRMQWSRFFASGQHDRYLPLGDHMTAAQLAAAKAFLVSRAADAPENQGAGIRED